MKKLTVLPLHFHVCIVFRNTFFSLLIFLICGCSQNSKGFSYPKLEGYDLANPVMIHLKTELDEISGIVYYPKDTSVFAINDELGLLYKIYIRKNIKVLKWKFSSEGDYEDLVLHDGTFYALQSNGNIKSFKFLSKDSVAVESGQLPLAGRNDFESLYYDNFHQHIFLVCKDCEIDTRKTISAFSFNPDDQTFVDEAAYQIDVSQIDKLLGNNKTKFKPSAAAIHPLTKELYLISSVTKAIAIADRDGKVREALYIDPRLFKQPEGLTFTPAGDMIISNESAGSGAPNILIFKYKPLLNEKG